MSQIQILPETWSFDSAPAARAPAQRVPTGPARDKATSAEAGLAEKARLTPEEQAQSAREWERDADERERSLTEARRAGKPLTPDDARTDNPFGKPGPAPKQAAAKVPQWRDITADPEYGRLNDADRKAVQESFWSNVIAPSVATDDLPAVRQAFFDAANPSMLSRAGKAIGGMFGSGQASAPAAAQAPAPTGEPTAAELEAASKPFIGGAHVSDLRNQKATTDRIRQKNSVMDGMDGTKVPTKPYSSGTPVNEETARNIADGVRLAREADAANPQSLQDALAGKPTYEQKITKRKDWVGAVARDAAARLDDEGKDVAKQTQDARIRLNLLDQGSIEPSTFDFEGHKAWKDSGPVMRGLAKARLGLSNQGAGIVEFFADTVGADSLANVAKSVRDNNDDKEAVIGKFNKASDRWIEGATTSLATQLPALLTSFPIAAGALPLAALLGLAKNVPRASMFVQTFGSEYGSKEARKLAMPERATRAALLATFEVVTESFGLGKTLEGIKETGKAILNPRELKDHLSKALNAYGKSVVPEVAGELVNTTAGTIMDAAPRIGLHPDVTAGQYFEKMADTLFQTLIQVGMMSGGSAAIAKGASKIPEGIDGLRSKIRAQIDAMKTKGGNLPPEQNAAPQVPGSATAGTGSPSPVVPPGGAAPDTTGDIPAADVLGQVDDGLTPSERTELDALQARLDADPFSLSESEYAVFNDLSGKVDAVKANGAPNGSPPPVVPDDNGSSAPVPTPAGSGAAGAGAGVAPPVATPPGGPGDSPAGASGAGNGVGDAAANPAAVGPGSLKGGIKIGAAQSARTGWNTVIESDLEVVPAKSLLTSFDPGYDQSLQPRDVTSGESEVKIQKMKQRPDIPHLTGESVTVSDGTPMVGSDGMVEAGNHRTAMIKALYAEGKGQAYRDAVIARARAAGVDSAALDGIQNQDPVLVRVRKTEVDNRAEFARKTNESGVAQMKASEQAKADAERINLAKFTPNDNGSIDTAENRDFVTDFVTRAIPPNDRSTYYANGRLTADGLTRIRNAILAKAYGGTDLLQSLTDDTEGGRNLKSALLKAAPALAEIADGAKDGRYNDIDIAPMLASAIRRLSDLQYRGLTLAKAMTQVELFGEQYTEDDILVIEFLEENSRSAKKIAEVLTGVADEVRALGNPGQPDMLGDTPPVPTAREIVRQQIERLKGRNAAQPDLLTPNGPNEGGEGAPPATPPGGTPPTPPPGDQGPGPDQRPPQPPEEKPPGDDGPEEGDGQGEVAGGGGGSGRGRRGGGGGGGGRRPRPPRNPPPSLPPGTPSPPPLPPRQPGYGDNNRAVDRAELDLMRQVLRANMRGINANGPLNPEVMMAGMKIAVFHIEAGTRAFADYVAIMVEDFGDAIRPYLRGWYESARWYPGFDATGMTSAADIDAGNDNDQAPKDPEPPVDPNERPDEPDAPTKTLTLRERLEAQKAAQGIKVVPRDRANIAETLPLLLDGQQDDVKFAEDRFAKPDGYGVMFTNGTGTGKSYSGMGIIKRLERQGKTNILIVAPNQEIMNVWKEAAKHFSVDIGQLDDTKTAGKGVVITTYANLGANRTLADRKWDLVVADESQNLMASADANLTNWLANFRAITMHPTSTMARTNMLHRDLADKIEETNKAMKAAIERGTRGEDVDALTDRLDKEINDLRRQWSAKIAEVSREVQQAQGAGRTRAAMFSATPFAYVETLDYGNGYLWDYNEGYPYDLNAARAYNEPSPRQYFFIRHFGYRMRVGALNKPDGSVRDDLMQRQFNAHLRNTRVLSTRAIETEHDYDRRFVQTDSEIGQRIDQGIAWIQDNAQGNKASRNGQIIAELFRRNFDFMARQRLLEAIKAEQAIPLIKAHIANGKSVVVFHGYKVGGTKNPFDFSEFRDDWFPWGKGRVKLAEVIDWFETQRPDLANLPIGEIQRPIDVFKEALGSQAVFLNGEVSRRDRNQAIGLFNDDNNAVRVLVTTLDAGFSVHDTTGKFPRVTINIGLPTIPVRAIQQEGRIFRIGQQSNAVFRYMSIGTNWERRAFAETIAQRASTVENLALGESARALKDAFIQAYLEAGDYPAGHDGEGTGGKVADQARNDALTDFDRAISFYFGQHKKTQATKAQEGVDYFPTPEPLGLKMVEWLDLKPGESVLEPSAGHGAIARWLPEDVVSRAIEPSTFLSSRLSTVFSGDIVDSRFEDHNIVNKYDGIVMNPPYGVGGKVAMEHVAKAWDHLRTGGRLIAILPSGPAMEKRFSAWASEVDADFKDGRLKRPDLRVVARMDLPAATFERAGTSVRTYVVVLEKSAAITRGPELGLFGGDNIQAFFDAIKDASMPPRAPVAGKVAEVRAQAAAANAPRRPAPSEPFEAFEQSLTGGAAPTPMARFTASASRDEYLRVQEIARKHGGRYFGNRYTPALKSGFQFPDAAKRDAFMAEAAGDKVTPPLNDLARSGTINSGIKFDIKDDIADLGRKIVEFTGDPAAADGYREARLPDHADLGAIAQAWGARLVGFTATNPALDFFNGLTVPGASRAIYINAKSSRPHFAVLGHELAHRLRAERPDLYEKLLAMVRKNAGVREFSVWAKRYDGVIDADVMEEFVGDVLSDGFMDRGFWREIGKASKPLLRAMAQLAQDLIDHALQAMGYAPKTRLILRDFDAVIKVAAEVMVEFGITQNAPSQSPLNDITPGMSPAAIYEFNGSAPAPARVSALIEFRRMRKRLDDGDIGAEDFVERALELHDRLEDAKAHKDGVFKARERGELWIRERLMRAKRKGEVDPIAVDMALWALDQNPDLATRLGISFPDPKKSPGTAGGYEPITRIMLLMKGRVSDGTVVHEILHHSERMMPVETQRAIAAEWLRALNKEIDKTKREMAKASPAKRDAYEERIRLLGLMFEAAMGSRVAQKEIRKAFEDGDQIDYADYHLTNPSEFWAVKATDILSGRYGARGSWVNKAAQWLREFVERLKGWLGLSSNSPILRGLRDVLASDGSDLSADVMAAQTESLMSPVDRAAHRAATSPMNDLSDPSDAQKDVGNYQKGHVTIAGLDVAIENPAGSRRRPEWPELKAHYGYVKGTLGKDGDQVDVFIRPGTPTDYNGPVFVVDQRNESGRFDEHKVMIGWGTPEAATAGYLENYTPGWDGLGAVTPMTLREFKGWLALGDTKRPASRYGPAMVRNRVLRAWRQIAAHDESFRYRGSQAKDIESIARDIDPALEVVKSAQSLSDVGTSWYVQDPKASKVGDGSGTVMIKHYDDGTVEIDASDQGEGKGGSMMYHIAATYAHNNGLIFKDDRLGISAIAVRRRTENLLSSALRYGTTRHLAPGDALRRPDNSHAKTNLETMTVADVRPVKWKDGDDANNLAELLLTSHHNVTRTIPEMAGVRYNFDAQRFENRDGTEFTDADFTRIAESDAGREAAAGVGTLKRAAVTSALLSGSSGTRPEVLVADGNGNAESVRLAEPLAGILYDIAPVRPAATAPTARERLANDITLTDRVIRAPFKLTAAIPGVRQLFAAGQGLLEKTGEWAAGTKTGDFIAAGVISNYGLNEDYLDRAVETWTNLQKFARATGTFVEKLATLNRAQARVAYLWMNEKPDTREEQALMENLPPASRQTLLDLKELVMSLGAEAVRLGQLSADVYERNKMAYLHRSYLKHEDAASLRENIGGSVNKKLWADQYKGRGLKDWVDMERVARNIPDWWDVKTKKAKADLQLKGKKFHRFERRDPVGEGVAPLPGMENVARRGKLREIVYWPVGVPPPAKFGEWDNDGIWEARYFKGGKVGFWRDFKPQERREMGEMDEIKFAIAKTLHLMAHDIEVGKMLEWIGGHYSVGKLEPGQREATARESLGMAYGKDVWVKVPNNDVPGTNVKRYGALADRFVPGPIWNDLRQHADLAARDNQILAAYQTALNAWKLSKTALSPAVHANNIMANFFIADFHDLRARDLYQALDVMLRKKGNEAKTRLYERFEDSGALHGLFRFHEIQSETINPLLDELRKEAMGSMADEAPNLTRALTIVSMLNSTVGAAKYGANKMIDAYSAEDEVFRLAMFLKGTRNGLSDKESGKLAREAFLDYNINAPWIQALRKTIIPFIAFPYRALPMMLHTFATKPWKLVKYVALGSILNAMAYAALSGDDDEEKERALLPKEKSGRVWGLLPKLIRMPWNHNNAPVFLDVRRWYPMGDVLETESTHSAIPMLPMMMPGGPLDLMFEVWKNTSGFTGQDITKGTDTTGERFKKTGLYAWRAVMPNNPIVPWSWSQTGLLGAAGAGDTWAGAAGLAGQGSDVFGRELSLPQAFWATVGVKLGTYPADVLERNTKSKAGAEAREIVSTAMKFKMDAKRGTISEQTAAERVREQRVKMGDLRFDLDSKLARSRGDPLPDKRNYEVPELESR